jgi:hypothetical protein
LLEDERSISFWQLSTLDCIPEETGSESSSIVTTAVKDREPATAASCHTVTSNAGATDNAKKKIIVSEHQVAASFDPTSRIVSNSALSHSDVQFSHAVPGHGQLLMAMDPLPPAPLPQRSRFLGTYAAPMPQPDNTLIVLQKAKEVLERKLLEEQKRLQREREKESESQELHNEKRSLQGQGEHISSDMNGR